MPIMYLIRIQPGATLMKSLRWLLLPLLLLPLTACGMSGGPFNGKVLEENTHKPIPGAIVVVRWVGLVSSWVDSQHVCYHVETATTDEEGRYQTKGWSQSLNYSVKFDRMEIDAYKLGYGRPSKLSQVKEIEYLAPFKGTRGERLAYLGNFSGMQCGVTGDYAPKLIPLYKVIYEEAKQLAVTKEDKKLAINRLRDLEEMEFGYDKSWENWRKRIGELQ